ncbi:hypothetical protein SCP_0115300 [Sparassis crispa]|uniref:DUF6533 domain-containing protein n=1 Tax=Sparassis crispa TaxID=139825 RepID=A0A401G901_9APHY|nr:hypothetical protein SCP_0115300 [Sparassis crispa]GBE78641.1 hypothetical protein SCP_0115300 [Sparassis crispa]
MLSGANGDLEPDQLAYQVFVNNCSCVAAATLLILDHAITLADEIDHIWRSRKSGATILFISNRFLGLVLAFSLVVEIPPWRTNLRSRLLFEACQELLLIEWATFLAFRVYAVGGHAHLLAVVVFVLSLMPFATNLYSYITNSYFVIVVPEIGPICMKEATSIVQMKLTIHVYLSFQLSLWLMGKAGVHNVVLLLQTSLSSL